MAISAIRAAKHLARHSDWKYTQLELQKLLYLSHMFHLVYQDGSPLVQGSFEAWEWGPVHPELYRNLMINGASPVPKAFSGWKKERELDEKSTEAHWLDYIANFFPASRLNVDRLLELTHDDDSAWKKLYKPMLNVTISNSDIIKEYHRKQNKHAKSEYRPVA